MSFLFFCETPSIFDLREQRSSSEDSMIKLLQYSPVIYEDDDAMAMSAEAYERMQKYKEAETSDSDVELLCYTATAEVKVDDC